MRLHPPHTQVLLGSSPKGTRSALWTPVPSDMTSTTPFNSATADQRAMFVCVWLQWQTVPPRLCSNHPPLQGLRESTSPTQSLSIQMRHDPTCGFPHTLRASVVRVRRLPGEPHPAPSIPGLAGGARFPPTLDSTWRSEGFENNILAVGSFRENSLATINTLLCFPRCRPPRALSSSPAFLPPPRSCARSSRSSPPSGAAHGADLQKMSKGLLPILARHVSQCP